MCVSLNRKELQNLFTQKKNFFFSKFLLTNSKKFKKQPVIIKWEFFFSFESRVKGYENR